jgi:hypothetical protein
VLPLLYLVAILRVRPDLRPRLAVVPKVLVAAGVAAVVALVPGLPSLPATVVAAVIYIALLLALRAVPDEVIDALPRPGRAA